MAKVTLDPPKALNKKSARLPEVRAEVRAAAQRLAEKAQVNAAGHGSLPEHISVTSGKVDSFVNMEHDDAAAIEFGGTYKNGRVQKGLHILSRAVKESAQL